MTDLKSIEQSISALTEHFNEKMAEFQRAIQTSTPASSPTSNINAQFGAFRVFVMASLESLQLQVQVLSRQCDVMETRSRRKMLLLHGIREVQKENLQSAVIKAIQDHLDLPELTETKINYCRRLGQQGGGKPRPILVKFHDLSLRNEIWFMKTGLKGTGITLSEFLTKERHDAFQAARQKFGISRCWTTDGTITVLGPDGKRHKVFTVAEVKAIGSKPDEISLPSTSAPATVTQPSGGPSNATMAVPKAVRSQGDKAKRSARR